MSVIDTRLARSNKILPRLALRRREADREGGLEYHYVYVSERQNGRTTEVLFNEQ
jgi:hypothetical protein